MAWENYEEKIVKGHNVHLHGWPNGILFNIHKIGPKHLKKCLDALTADPPLCYWVNLSDEQVEELLEKRGGSTEKVRKERSDKGVKRKRGNEDKENRHPLSSETVDTDSD